jgi:hypothetical protein
MPPAGEDFARGDRYPQADWFRRPLHSVSGRGLDSQRTAQRLSAAGEFSHYGIAGK